MGGIANNPQLQQATQLGQGLQQPGQVPVQGGRGPLSPFTLPSHYQSPYANYGFDPGLQSYLDQNNYRSTFDAGVGFQYDPTTQTFTGGTMGGQYNPIPLNVMQQAAGGNRDVLSPYFQSRFPQPPQQPQMPQRDPRSAIQQVQGKLTGQPQQIYSGLGTPIPTYGQPPGPGFTQLIQNLQQQQQPQGPQPGANIGRPAPGYGQRPQRGPVDRSMTPLTLQQGLGGLMNRR